MGLFKIILVCFIAGIGAGLGTGFAGLSAASVVGPLLSTFLDVSPYQLCLHSIYLLREWSSIGKR